MNSTPIHLLLADDDPDDRIFFKEALDELSLNSNLSTVEDGDQLMNMLTGESAILPDLVFLDLNMPRKTGVECLAEIKANDKLKSLKVIIYSTSFDNEMVDLLYEKGALLYICKPGDYSDLKKVIHEAINIASQTNISRPAKEFFVIHIN
jgi:CheY-like chemotaxis protein